MKLYVLRHAEAEEQLPGKDDAARRLTARGAARMLAAARGMRRMRLAFDRLLTSPVTRAAATAAIVASVYGSDSSPQTLPALATGVEPGEAVAALAKVARCEALMIVGHEPQLSEIVSLLLTGSASLVHSQFKKGGCVALELPDRVGHGPAELLWMMTNRQLRNARKPGS